MLFQIIHLNIWKVMVHLLLWCEAEDGQESVPLPDSLRSYLLAPEDSSTRSSVGVLSRCRPPSAFLKLQMITF